MNISYHLKDMKPWSAGMHANLHYRADIDAFTTDSKSSHLSLFFLMAHVDSEKQNPKDELAFPLKKSSQFP